MYFSHLNKMGGKNKTHWNKSQSENTLFYNCHFTLGCYFSVCVDYFTYNLFFFFPFLTNFHSRFFSLVMLKGLYNPAPTVSLTVLKDVHAASPCPENLMEKPQAPKCIAFFFSLFFFLHRPKEKPPDLFHGTSKEGAGAVVFLKDADSGARLDRRDIISSGQERDTEYCCCLYYN